MKPLLSLIVMLCCYKVLWSQYPNYTSYNIDNGAPSNEIYSIIQDKEGYIWLGCDAGVFRFNGVRYEHFTNSNLKSRSATGLTQTTSGKIFGSTSQVRFFISTNLGYMLSSIGIIL